MDLFRLFRFRNANAVLQVRNLMKRKLPPFLTQEDRPVEEYTFKDPSENLVFVWGLNEHGALGTYLQKKKKMKNRGDRRFREFHRPLRLHFGEYHRVKHIAAGYGFSAFAVDSKSGNKVYGTGLNTDSQIGYQAARRDAPLGIILAPVPIDILYKHPKKTKVTSISAGRAHLVINTDLEGVYTLGNNAYGQCGRDIVENEKFIASQTIFNIPRFSNDNIISVECGQDHTLFLTENGHVYACGWGADGQTGLGHYNCSGVPKKVIGDIEGEKIVKVSSRSDCVLALNDKGQVFGWGNSEYAQIFNQGENYVQINRAIHMKKCEGFGKIVDVAAAGSYCLMLNEAGEVFSWGYGLLGRGPIAQQSWIPEIIPPTLFGRNEFQPDCKVTSIYTGMNHSGAITNYGDIYIWGKNKGGCLGLGYTHDQLFPMRISVSALGKKLSLGVDHSIAICRTFGMTGDYKKKVTDEPEETDTDKQS